MKNIFIIALLLLILGSIAGADPIDFSNTSILISPNIKSPVNESLNSMLQEEVAKRTSLKWSMADQWGGDNHTFLAIVLSSDKQLYGIDVPHRKNEKFPEYKSEGYRIVNKMKDGNSVVWIIAADARASVFGVGYLLRKMILQPNQAVLEEPVDFATAPMQSIRGHQLGYRNTANSYDAWDVRQYDQYIRELVLFGTNAIENIPFGKSDDSPHMPIPREEMNIRMSEICDSYDIDYWVWTPATFDLTNMEKRQAMLNTHEAFYKKCPRLNHIFFPGGDPGHNHPRDVMPFLKDLSFRLNKYHPNAGIWISLQGFSAEQIDYFYTFLDEHKPDWLMGIVSGPSSPPIAETHHRLEGDYKHRQYPDITHNVRCEFPVANWDQAYMLTIGREGINPRPNFNAKIHSTYAPFTDGFSTYSDGVHDDVNKIIWSMRGWDINLEVRDILRDYCRFFFGPDIAERTADGIFALEQNWVGPIVENGGIETTFAFWQNLERTQPQLENNWRWQQLVLRAYYDTYQRRRKIYEVGLEKQANTILAQAEEIGVNDVMNKALVIVNQADSKPIAQDLYTKIVHYCDNLFQSIGLQTSVPKHQASNSQRGCILDFVNYPLNNRWWLKDEFEKIKMMNSEEEKQARLDIICNWENPGKGSYYDNVSNIEAATRVTTTSYDACDVAWWDNGYSRARLSSQLFQWEPILEYENLDFNGRYIIRICGLGEALIRIDGERLEPLLYNKGLGEFKEFVIPKHITRDGKMTVTFDRPEESHLRWKDFSHVSDVWVIKR